MECKHGIWLYWLCCNICRDGVKIQSQPKPRADKRSNERIRASKYEMCRCKRHFKYREWPTCYDCNQRNRFGAAVDAGLWAELHAKDLSKGNRKGYPFTGSAETAPTNAVRASIHRSVQPTKPVRD